jgi:hypothetical protein
VPRGTPDDEWLTVIGNVGLIVLTRDRKIRYRPIERQRWIDYGVRGFVLTGAGNMRVDDQLALLEDHWDRMIDLVGRHTKGPWMSSVTRSGIRSLIAPPP